MKLSAMSFPHVLLAGFTSDNRNEYLINRGKISFCFDRMSKDSLLAITGFFPFHKWYTLSSNILLFCLVPQNWASYWCPWNHWELRLSLSCELKEDILDRAKSNLWKPKASAGEMWNVTAARENTPLGRALLARNWSSYWEEI